jgi:hypothetical protein
MVWIPLTALAILVLGMLLVVREVDVHTPK